MVKIDSGNVVLAYYSTTKCLHRELSCSLDDIFTSYRRPRFVLQGVYIKRVEKIIFFLCVTGMKNSIHAAMSLTWISLSISP